MNVIMTVKAPVNLAQFSPFYLLSGKKTLQAKDQDIQSRCYIYRYIGIL